MNDEKYKKLYYSDTYFTLASSSRCSADQLRSILPFAISDNSASNYLLVCQPSHRGYEDIQLQKKYHLKNPVFLADSWKTPKIQIWDCTHYYRKLNRTNTFVDHGDPIIFLSPEHFSMVCFFLRVYVRNASIEFTNTIIKILEKKLGFQLVPEEDTPYFRKMPNFALSEEEWDSDTFLEVLDEHLGDANGWGTPD